MFIPFSRSQVACHSMSQALLSCSDGMCCSLIALPQGGLSPRKLDVIVNCSPDLNLHWRKFSVPGNRKHHFIPHSFLSFSDIPSHVRSAFWPFVNVRQRMRKVLDPKSTACSGRQT